MIDTRRATMSLRSRRAAASLVTSADRCATVDVAIEAISLGVGCAANQVAGIFSLVTSALGWSAVGVTAADADGSSTMGMCAFRPIDNNSADQTSRHTRVAV